MALRNEDQHPHVRHLGLALGVDCRQEVLQGDLGLGGSRHEQRLTHQDVELTFEGDHLVVVLPVYRQALHGPVAVLCCLGDALQLSIRLGQLEVRVGQQHGEAVVIAVGPCGAVHAGQGQGLLAQPQSPPCITRLGHFVRLLLFPLELPEGGVRHQQGELVHLAGSRVTAPGCTHPVNLYNSGSEAWRATCLLTLHCNHLIFFRSSQADGIIQVFIS
mmetsp:Transcript_15131/g.32820  ORF Transcript_15131/g.32820 Transcript_15131/m.32820 type:complete len:217 (-) Transcript_15131:385-1035(-)